MVEQLELVLNTIDSAVQATVFDENGGRLLFSNQRYYTLLEYPRARFESEQPDPFSFIHPADRERARELARQANQDRQPYTVTYRLLRPDGSLRWLQSQVSFIALPGEKRPVQLAVTNDVTTLKEMELKSAMTAAKLQAILDNVSCGITAITYGEKDVEYLLINDRYFELLGYTREQYNEIATFSPVYSEDRQPVIDAAAAAYRTGQPTTIEFRAVKRDGSLIWLRDAMTIAYFDGVEQPVQLSMFYDITAERQSIHELLDNLPCGAALYEYDGRELRVIHINTRYWELVDRAPLDSRDLSVMSAIHPEDRAIAAREIAAAVSQGRDSVCDLRVRQGQTGYRPFHIVGRIVPKAEGIYSVYASYTPISDAAMSVQEMLPVAIQAMMDSSSEVAFVKGKDLRYVSCSRRFARLSGYGSETELIGKSSADVFPAELAAQNDAVDREILESRKSYVDCDILFPTPTGVKHLLFSKYPLLDAAGNVLGIYGTGHDVTQTRQMQSQLELLTNNIPGGIAIYEGRPDALDQIRLIYFSDGFCRLFGYERAEYEELAAANPLCLVAADHLSEMYAKILDLLQQGITLDYIYRARTKTGADKWLNIKAVMGEPNGANMTVNAVFFDVTAQKEASEKLRVSEEINRLAIEQSGSIVCRYDVAAQRLTVSPNISPIFEIADSVERVPEVFLEQGRIAPETVSAYSAFFDSIRQGQADGEVLYQRRSSIGWRWVKERFTTIFSDDGQPATAVISFSDITESIEKDVAYKRWQQSLLSRAPESYTIFRCTIGKEITCDLREGSLLSVCFEPGIFDFDDHTDQYAAEYVVDEDKERFSSFLRADALRAAYAQGNHTQVLEYRELLPEDNYRWMRLTVDLVEYTHSSEIEAYLLFENIDEAKRMELTLLERAETDPLTGLLNRKTFAQRVERRLKEAPSGSVQALLMLDIDNFKLVNDVFGHSAGDQTLIDVAELLSAGSRRDDLVGRLGGDEFVVFLSGLTEAGAAAKKARQICDATRKTLSADLQISGSVGIALYPQDGGSFDALYKKADDTLYYVKDRGKNGYAFYRPEMTADSSQRQRVENRSTVRRRREKKRRMLIVDDNRMDHELLANIFQDSFNIEQALNGSSALTLLEHYGSALSIVLLDLMMPDMDGFAVLKQMRQNEEMRDIPVIVVSGADDQATSLAAIRAGATDFATKPVDPEILRIRVQSAVSKAENQRLRAHNSYLELQNRELHSFKAALERAGLLVISLDLAANTFTYSSNTGQSLAGKYDSRPLWDILLSDQVAEAATVEKMRQLVDQAVNNTGQQEDQLPVRLESAAGGQRLYTMRAFPQNGLGMIADKIIITFSESAEPADRSENNAAGDETI